MNNAYRIVNNLLCIQSVSTLNKKKEVRKEEVYQNKIQVWVE